MDNRYETRLARAMAELEASTIRRHNYAPPMFRLARRVGLKPRPPHYMSFRRAIFLLGPCIGVTWGGLMWLLQGRDAAQVVPTPVLLAASILAGIGIGALMAAYYRWAGSEAGLSKWEDL
jgi:hypothetical protein